MLVAPARPEGRAGAFLCQGELPVSATVLERSVDVAAVLERVLHRFPDGLVDAIVSFEPGRRLTAIKNVTVTEDFFQGHFPGVPLMPGVLIIESMSQVASILMLHDGKDLLNARAYLRGVNGAKFRKQVVPGDQVTIEVERRVSRGALVRVSGVAKVDGEVVAEATLLMAVVHNTASVHPTARVHPDAVIGAGTVIGPHVAIGPDVRIGRNNKIGAGCVIDGWVEIGDDNTLFPLGSYGLPPQDLKYQGEHTSLIIGNGNTFREFVTLHRGTVTGHAKTVIGNRNYLMAYCHVAHDCTVGDDNILSHATTLGGHVEIGNFVTFGGYAGVHQFCRVGNHAFVGGYSACTKDVLPYSKTVGNRAMIYGLNTIGLVRRGFTPDTLRKLKAAYRYLLVSKLTTTAALQRIDQDETTACPEVQYLVSFIRSAKRGVVLKRATRRTSDAGGDD
jgi:UDP-N-acetylglucosamine acyltransferase